MSFVNATHITAMNALHECLDAMSKHAPMNSAHEAYAVILEELDEFWDEVKKKRSQRSEPGMCEELTQIAAMAIRAIVDLKLHTLNPERELLTIAELRILLQVQERQRHGRQKYGQGPADLAHDDAHTPEEWESMIRDHAHRAAISPPMDSRSHLLDVIGLAKSAIESIDRKAQHDAGRSQTPQQPDVGT